MTNDACPIQPPDIFASQLALLKKISVIAVVGMSPNSDRPSHEVGLYLCERGYRIVPIHPAAREIAGLTVFPSLSAAVQAGEKIDLVDLFVSGERVSTVVEEALSLGLRRIWFQPGTEWAPAQARARDAGAEVVEHACTMAVLKRAGQ